MGRRRGFLRADWAFLHAEIRFRTDKARGMRQRNEGSEREIGLRQRNEGENLYPARFLSPKKREEDSCVGVLFSLGVSLGEWEHETLLGIISGATPSAPCE